MKWVEENVVQKGRLGIPDNFTVTAPIHVMGQPELTNKQPITYTNPQTEAFCALVGANNFWAASKEERKQRQQWGRSVERCERKSGGRGRGG
jgi:lariat debranching enzyme